MENQEEAEQQIAVNKYLERSTGRLSLSATQPVVDLRTQETWYQGRDSYD